MADGKIEIDTAINTDGAEKGINSLREKLKQLGNTSTLKGLSNIGSIVNGAKVAFDVAAKAVKAVIAEIKELTQAYKTQEDAETRLSVAARNNPYLDDFSVKKLKEYAGELQNIGEIGDETLLPMMAELAASGRTYNEIQDIMSAALDASASGMVSMESAVQSLNMSYSGATGQLSRLIPSLKDLTEEELRSGKAIEAVKKAYGGMAEATANTDVQLANAFGDLRERLGGLLNRIIEPLQKGLLTAVNAANALWDKTSDILSGGEKEQATTLDGRLLKAKAELEELNRKAGETEKKFGEMSEAHGGYTDKIAEAERRLAEAREKGNKTAETLYSNQLRLLRQTAQENNANKGTQAFLDETTKKRDEETEAIKRQIEAKKLEIKEIEDAIRQNKSAEELAKEIAERDRLRAEYDATIAAKEKEIAIRKAAGEEISAEAEAQELYNTALQAYVKMMSDPAFEGNSGNYEHEVNARKYIGDQADIIKTKETEEAYNELAEQIRQTADDGAKSIREQYDALIEELEKEFERVTGLQLSDDGSIANIEDANAQELELYQQLQDAKVRANEEANEKIKQENADSLASNAELVNSFITQFADITGQMTNLMRENLNAETAKETADLDKQYSDGLISYEEYCDKKAEIDKKAAREEYKIKMIEWTMQLATAAANIAEGMTKALAQNGYPLGAIMAGLAAASGALQIATIVANKPKPPAFATGGIVGGNSYTGDNVIARVNSGERILTQAQSKALENSIASLGSGGGGVSMNVKIINNASDEVRAQSQLDMDGLKITIDKLVNTSFQQGNYTDSMNIAQGRQNGAKLL